MIVPIKDDLIAAWTELVIMEGNNGEKLEILCRSLLSNPDSIDIVNKLWLLSSFAMINMGHSPNILSRLIHKMLELVEKRNDG